MQCHTGLPSSYNRDLAEQQLEARCIWGTRVRVLWRYAMEVKTANTGVTIRLSVGPYPGLILQGGSGYGTPQLAPKAMERGKESSGRTPRTCGSWW